MPGSPRHSWWRRSALLNARRPRLPSTSVRGRAARGTPCVMVAHGTPCLGLVTQAGCGAICPAYGRGCYGCFGPMESPNIKVGAAVAGARRGRPGHAAGTCAPSTRTHLPSGRRASTMSDGTREIRTITARVEGEGDARPGPGRRARGGAVQDLRAPRFFEALPGRHFTEDRTSPRASAASARSHTWRVLAAAMEQVCGVELPAQLQALRRLIYREWIEHAQCPARGDAARARLPRLRRRDRVGPRPPRLVEIALRLKKLERAGARQSAAARCTRSTSASAASTARRPPQSCARSSRSSSKRATRLAS